MRVAPGAEPVNVAPAAVTLSTPAAAMPATWVPWPPWEAVSVSLVTGSGTHSSSLVSDCVSVRS